MAPSDKNISEPDILIIHVSDGSTVAESIAGRFRGDKYNLQVHLCPLNKALLSSSASSQSLSAMVSSPPRPAIPPRRKMSENFHQFWAPTSTSPTQSPKFSSSFPQSSGEMIASKGMTLSPGISTAERTTPVPLSLLCNGQMERTMPVLLMSPGMLKHLRTIAKDSKATLIEELHRGQDPVALQCFVSEAEVNLQLAETFGDVNFRWRHLEVGQSRESFQRCVIGLMTLMEEGQDVMPLPSLKQFSLLPDKPVMPGDTLYILLDSHLSDVTDTSALDLHYPGVGHATARRISDLLYEFQAPGVTEQSIPMEVFTVSGEFLGRETIHYTDKTQLLTSLLLQVEEPAQLVCRLFPAELVPRDEIDVALSDWSSSAHKSQGMTNPFSQRELPTLLHVAAKYNLACLAQSLLADPDYYPALTVGNQDAMTPEQLARCWNNTDIASYLASERESTRSSLSSECEDSQPLAGDDYVTPDRLLASDLALYFDKLQLPSNASRGPGRKISSTSCPEMRQKRLSSTAVKVRCSSFPLSPDEVTYRNQGREACEPMTQPGRSVYRGYTFLTHSHQQQFASSQGRGSPLCSHSPAVQVYASPYHHAACADQKICTDTNCWETEQVQWRSRDDGGADAFSAQHRAEHRKTQHVYESLGGVDDLFNSSEEEEVPREAIKEIAPECPPNLPPPRKNSIPMNCLDGVGVMKGKELSLPAPHVGKLSALHAPTELSCATAGTVSVQTDRGSRSKHLPCKTIKKNSKIYRRPPSKGSDSADASGLVSKQSLYGVDKTVDLEISEVSVESKIKNDSSCRVPQSKNSRPGDDNLPDPTSTKPEPRARRKCIIKSSLQTLASSITSSKSKYSIAENIHDKSSAPHVGSSAYSSKTLEQTRNVYAHRPAPALPEGRSKSLTNAFSSEEARQGRELLMKHRSNSTGTTPSACNRELAPPTFALKSTHSSETSNDWANDDDVDSGYSQPFMFHFDGQKYEDITSTMNIVDGYFKEVRRV